MTASSARQIVLASRPEGWVVPENFSLREAALPALAEGDVLVRAIYLSLDPYMRGRMDAAKSYAENFQVGKPLKARAIGAVAASRNGDYREGDIVFGVLDWADLSHVPGGNGLRPVDTSSGAPLAWHLGALGMPGMTAWVGVAMAEPKAGETFFVSAASGAVGQIAGQIAKIRGCRVVGCAGTDAKVAYLLDDLGFDAGFNHRTQAHDLLGALQRAAPDGLDIYFDNVGGAILEAALDHANTKARVTACGMISQYNLTREETPGVRNLTHIVRKRIRMEGFIVSDHAAKRPAFEADMAAWLKAGKIKYRVDVAEGLDAAPAAFIAMLKGDNFGKQVVRVSREP